LSFYVGDQKETFQKKRSGTSRPERDHFEIVAIGKNVTRRRGIAGMNSVKISGACRTGHGGNGIPPVVKGTWIMLNGLEGERAKRDQSVTGKVQQGPSPSEFLNREGDEGVKKN